MLASAARSYWQKWPVLIKAPNAVESLTSMRELLRGAPYRYNGRPSLTPRIPLKTRCRPNVNPATPASPRPPLPCS